MSVYTLSQVRSGLGLTPPARFAVIGDPIAHSKSPAMQNAALQADGVDAQYIRVHVPAGQVADAFAVLRDAGFVGVNITIPHKFEALGSVHEIDELAQQLGAVNTLHIGPDGSFTGYNTDGPGYLNSLREAFGSGVSGQRVLIFGAAGGAGRAVAVQSALAGAQHLYLVNRTQEKLPALAAELQQLAACHVSTVAWEDAALSELLPAVDIIVNATSLGMKEPDKPLLPLAALQARHAVFDMVYLATGRTWLGQAAGQKGARYVDGQTLLLHQGALSYQHWLGRPAPLEAMRAGLAAALHS
jgi:shikimate dehydrogenase